MKKLIVTLAAFLCAPLAFSQPISSNASGLRTATTVVSVSTATAPTLGQVLTALSATAADWETPANATITGGTCTNQFVTAISINGVPTCTTDTLASAQHANQGTTTTVLHGNGAGNPAFGSVVEGDLALTDVTTANVSTSAHGFAPKLDNVATHFLNGQGGYTTPAGGITNAAGNNVIPKSNGTNLLASSISDDGTTITTPETITQTSTSATSFQSGANGTTNPAFQIDNSTASAATGIVVKPAAAGAGILLKAISSGTNENIYIQPKATGRTIFTTSTGVGYGGTAAAPIVDIDGSAEGFFSRAPTQSLDLAINGVHCMEFQGNNPGIYVLNGCGSTFGFNNTSTFTGYQKAGIKYIADGVLGIVGGTGASPASVAGGWAIDGGRSIASAQFNQTSTTTLTNVPGLTVTVLAGRTYSFVADLYTTSNVAGGVQAAISGTATATSIVYEGYNLNASTITGQTRASALGTAVAATTAVTAAHTVITGSIVVNAGGTLTVQFAQNASNGTASSVLVGSTFVVLAY